MLVSKSTVKKVESSCSLSDKIIWNEVEEDKQEIAMNISIEKTAY